jgi:hypothetical protein
MVLERRNFRSKYHAFPEPKLSPKNRRLVKTTDRLLALTLSVLSVLVVMVGGLNLSVNNWWWLVAVFGEVLLNTIFGWLLTHPPDYPTIKSWRETKASD